MFKVQEVMNVHSYYNFFKVGMKVQTNPGLSIFDNRKDLEIKEATIIEVIEHSPLKKSQDHLEDVEYFFMAEEWEIANRSISVKIRIDKLHENTVHLLVGDVFSISDIIISPKDVAYWRKLDLEASYRILSDYKRRNAIKQSDALIGQLYLVPLNGLNELKSLSSPFTAKLPLI